MSPNDDPHLHFQWFILAVWLCTVGVTIKVISNELERSKGQVGSVAKS